MMIDFIKIYPSDSIFFLNCWTWGYEVSVLACHLPHPLKFSLRRK